MAEKALAVFTETTLKEIIEVLVEKNISQLRIETIDLKMGIKFASLNHSEIDCKGLEEFEEEKSEVIEDNYITSGLVGIFHRASTPFEPPLVDIGKDVSKGQIIGYIESMRLMHEVRSPCDGLVKEIHVIEGQNLEYGQKMFSVKS